MFFVHDHKTLEKLFLSHFLYAILDFTFFAIFTLQIAYAQGIACNKFHTSLAPFVQRETPLKNPI